MQRIPKPGEIYKHFKGDFYQIITIALHSETQEYMVVYQALYGDFRTYVRPLEMFISEIDSLKYPETEQKYRFELKKSQDELYASGNHIVNKTDASYQEEMSVNNIKTIEAEGINAGTADTVVVNENSEKKDEVDEVDKDEIKTDYKEESSGEILKEDFQFEEVNSLLLEFLDSESYNRKLEVLTSNMKHLNDRLINDMAAALDITVEEGSLEERIQSLINCLQALCRFEDRRLR